MLGAVTGPSAVLIRPDGYVAWVGAGTDAGLRDALTTWFGDGLYSSTSLGPVTEQSGEPERTTPNAAKLKT